MPMRPSRTAALGVLAALAAALAATAPSGGAAPPPAPVWAAPVIIDDDPDHSAGEPSIDSAPDGTLYITAPTGLIGLREPIPKPVARGGDLLWRSDDGGLTWTYLATYDAVFGGGDADVVAVEDGAVYASGLTLACVSVARSGDRGETWVNNPVACSNTPVDDRQWNDASDAAVYTAFGNIAAREMVVNRSLLSSPAVVPGPSIVVSGTERNYQWPGVLAVDQNEERAYVAWNTQGAPNDCDEEEDCKPIEASTETPDEIRVAVLQPGDFTDPSYEPAPKLVASRPFDTFDAFVGVDVDERGRVYVVWNERHPVQQETWSMIASSTDYGETWSEPVKVNTIPTTVFPWVTAGEGGRLAVSYYGTSAKGNSPETVAGEWRVYSAYSDDYGATWVETVATPDPLHLGSVCTSGTGCGSGERDLLDFFETDMDPNGCLVVTYTDNARDQVVAGQRVTNEPELVAFVRQVSGPGLKAGSDCTFTAAGPAPTTAPSPDGTPTPTPAPAPTSTDPPGRTPPPLAGPPRDLAATGGLPDALPVAAGGLAALLALALRRRRRARAG